jgi:tRNA(fMet)-specific endonuclease VapC
VTFLLDTNTCIGILNGTSPGILEHQRRTPASQVRLCSIVKAELLHGAEKSAARERVLQKLQGFFARFRSMPFDDRAAGGYGEIRAALEKSGNVIGPNDLLIAAIARVNGLTLVTHNSAEVSRVPGLGLEDWEAIRR